MIENISLILARQIQKSYNPADIDVMAYEIGKKLNFYGVILLTITFSLWFGNVQGSLVSMLSFAILRSWSGGKHFSLTVCTIVCAFSFILIPLLNINTIIQIFIALISFVAFWSRTQGNKRICCILFLSFSICNMSTVLLLTFLFQSILIWGEESNNEKMG